MVGKKVFVSIQTERGEQTIVVDPDSLRVTADGIDDRLSHLIVQADKVVKTDNEGLLVSDLQNLQEAFQKASKVKP